MSDYPQMLVKPGKAIKWAAFDLDTLVVHDEAEEKAARSDEWVSPHELVEPLDHDGDGKPGGSLPKARRGRKQA
jgi:hypothetical protein